jgi:hypothetical protein
LVLNNFPISRVLDTLTPPAIQFPEGGMETYSPEVEAKMTKLFSWLSEKDRRRYAAIEAAKLGHGGVDYVARLFGCDPKTIRFGLHELEADADPAGGRVRKKGGDDHP